MKKLKSLFLITATLLLLTVALCFNASAAEWVDISNTVRYNFEEDTGVMVIRGKGEIPAGYFGQHCSDHFEPQDKVYGCQCNIYGIDFSIDEENMPGYQTAQKVRTLIIEEGITSFKKSDLYKFKNLGVVILPQSITKIPAGAFFNLKKLHTVTLSYSTTSIGNYAFAGCYNLRNIYIPETVKTIGTKAFEDCDKNNIKIPDSFKDADKLVFSSKTILYSNKREGYKVYLGTYSSSSSNPYEKKAEFYTYNKSTKKYTKIGDTNNGGLTLDEKTLKPGKTYYIVARSYVQTDVKKLYDVKSEMLTITMPPAKVSKVTAKATATTVTLNWAKSENATGYRIYKKIPPTPSWTNIGTTSNLSYTVKNLKPGTFDWYAVRPYIKATNGEILWGDYVKIRVSTLPETPVAKTSSPSKGKASISWAKAEGAEKYQLYYKINNGSYKLYKTYDSAQNLTFSNLKSGAKYTFAVRAYWSINTDKYYSAYTPVSVKIK